MLQFTLTLLLFDKQPGVSVLEPLRTDSLVGPMIVNVNDFVLDPTAEPHILQIDTLKIILRCGRCFYWSSEMNLTINSSNVDHS